MTLRTEDQVRDYAKLVLGFDEAEENVDQGTGQITTLSTKPKIIGYNELLRLVHYNRQGEGYNKTEKPEKYAKFHYI